MRPTLLYTVIILFIVAAIVGKMDFSGWALHTAGIFGIALALTIAIVVIFIARGFFSAGGKIARLVAAKRYPEALALAESLPPESLDTADKINVIAAHHFSGQDDKARTVLATIADSDNTTIQGVIADWRMKLGAEQKS